MPVKRAKTLSNQDLDRIFAHIAISSRQPFREALLVSFTAYAGLRIQEACSVHKRDFTDAHGNIAETLFVSGRGAKYGKSRTVPIIPELKARIVRYLASPDSDRPRAIRDNAIFANIYGKVLSAKAASGQVGRIYKAAGLIGCSSHSGRRTFGTRMARQLALQAGRFLICVLCLDTRRRPDHSCLHRPLAAPDSHRQRHL